jgi:superfamily II DNA helicase RecQ
MQSECWLFFSGSDYLTWKRILEASEPEMLQMRAAKLEQMYRYDSGVSCRHGAILRYFHQNLDQDNCKAFNICLFEVEEVPNNRKPLTLVMHFHSSRGGAEFILPVTKHASHLSAMGTERC